jgi:threonine synthase
MGIHVEKLVCTKCNEEFPLNEKIWKCECGGLLDIDFKSTFPVDKIKGRKPTMWRYREAIPILDDKNIISFDEGFTPLIDVAFHDKSVLVKQDHLFPTGSYKDRGASVLVSKVGELAIKKVVEDSSGNAGCAIAAYCAKAQIDCEIFVPEDTAAGKLAQIQFYKAKLNKISGSREDTAHAVLKAADGNLRIQLFSPLETGPYYWELISALMNFWGLELLIKYPKLLRSNREIVLLYTKHSKKI